MKLPTEGDNGSQPRDYVLQRLIDFNIGIQRLEDGLYEVSDSDGDIEVLWLDDPVNYRQIAHLWRRFGHREGMLITDFVAPRVVH